MEAKKPIYGKDSIRVNLIVGAVIVSLVLTACSPEPTPIATPKTPTPTLALPTAISARPTRTIPPPTPIQLPPTPAPECPSPTEGTQLLRNESYGYCFLYPDYLVRVDIPPYEMCLVPEGPAMACHSASIFINVEVVDGRTVDQVADERIAQLGFDPGRSGLTIGGEVAVMFADVGGQASSREVLFVHDDRLYTLGFILPDPEDGLAVEQFERLYNTVINSFTFIPISVSLPVLPAPQVGVGPMMNCSTMAGDEYGSALSITISFLAPVRPSPPPLLPSRDSGGDAPGGGCAATLVIQLRERHCRQARPVPFAQAPFRIHSDPRPSSVM